MIPRPLTPGDLEAVDGLQPAGWPPFRATFERYFTLPCCHPFGIEEGGRLVSMGTLIAFGTSGWIAQLVTAPEARGRGLATAMLGFLGEEGRRRGLETLSLVATDEGYPLYLKAGFRVEGEYGFWIRAQGPAPPEPGAWEGLSQGSPGSRETVAALDREASGEDRHPYWGDRCGDAWTFGAAGVPSGFYLPRVGEGLVVARSDLAGVPLLHRRLDGSTRCVVPGENPGPRSVLESRGFAFDHGARRMVLGPSLTRTPRWLWSRIGGNLG